MNKGIIKSIFTVFLNIAMGFSLGMTTGSLLVHNDNDWRIYLPIFLFAIANRVLIIKDDE